MKDIRFFGGFFFRLDIWFFGHGLKDYPLGPWKGLLLCSRR